MYTNLTLYYLNQMGIVPWVHKSCELPAAASVEPLAISCRLLVVFSSTLSSKAQSLFKQILNYLALAETQLTIRTLTHSDELSSYLNVNTPLFIVTFGLNPNPIVPNDERIVTNLSLEEILMRPANKKQVFQQLSRIKMQLTAHQES